MARPQRSRRVCSTPAFNLFLPSFCCSSEEAAGTDAVVLTIDEYEVLRLVDFEGLTHSECARQMNISRTTATEICEAARRKTASSLVLGKKLYISGGNWELCSGGRDDCYKSVCFRNEADADGTGTANVT